MGRGWLSLWVVLSVGCEAVPGWDGEFVDGKMPVAPEEWPAIALLENSIEGFFLTYCGGVLVEPDKVMTAAHCALAGFDADAHKIVRQAKRDAAAAAKNVAPAASLFNPFGRTQGEVDAEVEQITLTHVVAAAEQVRAFYTNHPRQVGYYPQAQFLDKRDTRFVISSEIAPALWPTLLEQSADCATRLRTVTPAASAIAAFESCLGGRNLEHDFAFLTLNQPVDVPVIRLATAADPLRADMDAVFLGHSSPDGIKELGLTQMKIETLDCSPDQGCSPGLELIAAADNPVGLCVGDSGGPLVVGAGQGQMVVGFLSAGVKGTPQPCGPRNVFGRADALAGWYRQPLAAASPTLPAAPIAPEAMPPTEFADRSGGCNASAGGSIIFSLVLCWLLRRAHRPAQS